MEALLQGLFNAHVDFDFGDELILEWMGEVESGAVRIGQMRYPIVVLPYLENMEDHTFALLAQFLQKGGKVLTIGNALTRIQGIADKRLQSLEVADGYASFQSLEALLEAVQALVPERVRILEAARSCECAEIACLTKEYCDHRAIFAVNTDALRDCDVRILLPQSWVGNLHAVNLLTGDMEDCAIEPWDKNFVCLAKRFMAGESALYLLENEGVHASVPRKSVEQEQVLFLPPRARVTRTHPNALLLDTCRWRLGDGHGGKKNRYGGSKTMCGQAWECGKSMRMVRRKGIAGFLRRTRAMAHGCKWNLLLKWRMCRKPQSNSQRRG